MSMDMFHVIEDAFAIVRKPKGVYAQVKMYHRGESVFIAYGSGFVRLGEKFGQSWGTSHPDIKVIDFDAAHVGNRNNPSYLPAKLRAVQ